MRTLVMGLNIGVCSEGVKDAKKRVILDYLIKHIKVNIYNIHSAMKSLGY